MRNETLIETVSTTAYECVRAWDIASGIPDASKKPVWAKLPAPGKEEVYARVNKLLTDPRLGDASFHNQWMEALKKEGWSHGKTFDDAKRTDPLLVPFHLLPFEYQTRERLFRTVVITASRV